MATTTRATPSTEPFPALESGPRTPTSIPVVTGVSENPNLLRPHSSHSSDSALSPKSGEKPGFAAGGSPLPLTGAAAMAELRKRKQQQKAAEEARELSSNPAVQAVQSLMGTGGMSKPSDAPAPDKLSEPLRQAAEKMNMSDGMQSNSMQTSPMSLSSFGTIESSGAASALTATTSNPSATGQHFVAEPAQMAEPGTYSSSNGHLAPTADQEGPKAFSYPGPPPHEQSQEGGPSRGMSLPGYGQGSPKSPASNKRHKCPYCSTDFTRHHNLKSHLLTHSQEKPYVCQTCQARFRRLHDLKRHTKLHTGERPHTCDKCGRRFARGDALARHNKGPGGCAGRRSSLGGDDEFGGDGAEGMDGVEFDDEGSSPDNGRRVSEPSRKRAHLETPNDTSREVYRQHSSTYPPVQNRPHAGSSSSMGPPQVILPGASNATSPRDMSNQASPAGGSSISSSYYGGSGQVFPGQGGMIESPKPLSPGQPPSDQHRLSVGDGSMSSVLHNRNRSPSLTTQFQQAHFGRGSGGRTPPQPPAQFATSHHGAPQVPVLPPLGSQPQGRPGLQPTSTPGGPGPSMLHHQQVPPPGAQSGGGAPGSNPGSLSSHGQSSGSSMRDIMGHDASDIWGYVRSLEQRFGRMQDEYELRINRLHEEVITLKGQMSAAASYSSDMQRGDMGGGSGQHRY